MNMSNSVQQLCNAMCSMSVVVVMGCLCCGLVHGRWQAVTSVLHSSYVMFTRVRSEVECQLPCSEQCVAVHIVCACATVLVLKLRPARSRVPTRFLHRRFQAYSYIQLVCGRQCAAAFSCLYRCHCAGAVVWCAAGGGWPAKPWTAQHVCHLRCVCWGQCWQPCCCGQPAHAGDQWMPVVL